MRPTRLTAIAVVLLAGAALGASLSAAALVTVSSARNPSLGPILVDSRGRTLYENASESRKAVRCAGACAARWPPLLVAGGARAIPGPGVRSSLLGTLKRPDGRTQVTYRGRLLYRYRGDRKAGEVEGQGLGGVWHAVAPSGAAVTRSAAPAVVPGGMPARATNPANVPQAPAAPAPGPAQPPAAGGGGAAGAGGGMGGSGGSDCAANPGGYGCM